MEILRHEFGGDVAVDAGVFAPPDVVRVQNETEIDPAISSFPLSMPGGTRWSLGWFKAQSNVRLGTSFYPHLNDLKKVCNHTCVALEIGGDHYSLDYGKPLDFMAMDRFFQTRRIPVVLWGASVGPFDSDRKFANRMFKHLRAFPGIFVRETESLDYLRSHGVEENVYLMGDPAFVMQSIEPPASKVGTELGRGAIGINLSPMLAFYRGQHPADVNIEEWVAFCSDLVRSAGSLGRPIILVPHVGSSDPGNDDFAFLGAIRMNLADGVGVPIDVIPEGLNAAELKSVISRCSVFAGARTHSTIAALSSHVPTLSIGYSLKARGINRDTFGHLEYCIAVADLTEEKFVERLGYLLAHEDEIRDQLAVSVPGIAANAMNARIVLRQIVDRSTR